MVCGDGNSKIYSKISFSNYSGSAERMFYGCKSLKYITFKISFEDDTKSINHTNFARNILEGGVITLPKYRKLYPSGIYTKSRFGMDTIFAESLTNKNWEINELDE